MSLHATVYCDCFERGRLRTPPRPEWKVYVDDECGARFSGADELELKIAFDAWNSNACEHPNGALLTHRLGSMDDIRSLRGLLEPHDERVPVLLGQVIHNVTHFCDSLPLREGRAARGRSRTR